MSWQLLAGLVALLIAAIFAVSWVIKSKKTDGSQNISIKGKNIHDNQISNNRGDSNDQSSN